MYFHLICHRHETVSDWETLIEPKVPLKYLNKIVAIELIVNESRATDSLFLSFQVEIFNSTIDGLSVKVLRRPDLPAAIFIPVHFL